MKNSKPILICITCCFICLLIGLFIGRNALDIYVPISKATTEIRNDIEQQPSPKDGKVDLNTATLQQLQLLPGIGESIAQRIIDYRVENNGFTDINDLLNVKGIGEKLFAKIKDEICL